METTIRLRSSELTPERFDKIQQWIHDKKNADITIKISEYEFEFYEEPFDAGAFMDEIEKQYEEERQEKKDNLEI